MECDEDGCLSMGVISDVKVFNSTISLSNQWNRRKMIGVAFLISVFVISFACLCVVISWISNESSKSEVSGKIHTKFSHEGEFPYHCKGTCYCSQMEDDFSRRSANTISKSVFFAVAAVSTSLALHLAKNYFDSDCLEKFSPVCSVNDVSSDVEFCEKFVASTENVDTLELNKDYFEEFECEGFCETNGKLRLDSMREAAEEFGCNDLVKDGIVRVSLSYMDGKYFQKWDKNVGHPVRSKDGDGSPNMHYVARTLFLTRELKTFCKMKSLREITYNGGVTRDVALCVGAPNSGKHRWSNISCRKVGQSGPWITPKVRQEKLL